MFDYKEKKISRQPKRRKTKLRPLVLILGIFAVASLGIIAIALLKNWSFPASAAPGIYKVLNYQGKLEDSGGVTVADGAYNIKFTIYDAAAAGNVLWSARESDACGAAFNPAVKSVTTSLGVFSTQLGESGDCPLNLDFNSDSYYLGITIGADSEMTPRKRIGAAGYAFNADLLDGLNTSLVGGASSFVPATDSSGNLVLTANVTFDTPTFFLDSTNDNIGIGTITPTATRTLDLTTAKKYGIYASSSAAINHMAVIYAEATDTTNVDQMGGYFSSASPSGKGVYGAAVTTGNPLVANQGGYFTAAGDSGQGVYGEGSASGAVTNYGGYFVTQGDTGYAIRGLAMATGGVNYGGYFRANGPGGYGVYGYAADASAVANYGGYFTAAGTGAGTSGVYGLASGAGAVYGVRGEVSNATAVTNYGGYFTAAGSGALASGVYGEATAAGSVIGVRGYASDLTAGITNYGGYFSAQGGTARAVFGDATNNGAEINYGGYFTARGSAVGTSGVYGEASASAAVYGVYGKATDTGAVANYGGYFTAAGEDGAAVYGAATSAAGTANNVGGYFTAAGGGADAYGVYATVTGGGNNFGIYASTISATGWAGFFNGGRGIYALRFSINDGITVVDYNTIGPALAGHVAAGEITDQNDLFINGNLEVDGAVWLDGGHTDLAEMVAYSGEGEAGDVVVVDENNDNSAKIAAKPYDQSILGIISTKPTLVITGDITEGKLMAVAGRVPTKVTNINGAIHRGDPLTTSSLPGYAMKATEAGPIVGKSLGECDQQECVIWVFLNVSWYGGI